MRDLFNQQLESRALRFYQHCNTKVGLEITKISAPPTEIPQAHRMNC